ncbi:hypothetical protein HZA97_07320 [Candidatus Woesearchaeota archaeon]|nr:hypothetical protein [Candidatus Woesearchaeota archaeon]
MDALYWVFFVFAALLSVLLLLKVLKGLIKLAVLCVSLVLVLSALTFTYALVTEQSFTGMLTLGLNYTKDKVKDYAGDKTKNIEEFLINQARNTTKESVNELINSLDVNTVKDLLSNNEKLINKRNNS